MEGGQGAEPTQEDLQGIGVQLQALGLLLHHIHVLHVLVVEAVHAGVGQHLGEPPSAGSPLRLLVHPLPHSPHLPGLL